MRDVELTVSIFDGYGSELNHAVTIIVGHPFVEVFEPMDRCDIVLIPLMLRGRHVTEGQFRVRAALRKKYAEYLSKIISEKLVEAMSRLDTVNGYPVVKK